VDDATIVRNSAIDAYMGNELLKNSSDGDDAGLIQFLERPFSYASGYLQPTDDASTFPNYRPLADVCQREPYISKLKGRYAIRANMKIRFEVNAQKFQSGRYILAWVPTGGAYGNGHDEYMRMHRHTLTQITQLPHVEIDLSTQTEAILEIPYVSFTNAMGIGNGTVMGDPGYVFLYPYVPLGTVVGGAAASYNLWFQMQNVELVSIALPQMGKTTGQQERDAAKLGAYSSIASKIGQTAGQLGKIPMLSAFTSPAQFVAETLSGALQIWGLSKPPNFKPIERVENVPFSMNACANVSDPTQPLALDVNNTMSMIPAVGGTNVDEMSISYLKSIYSYYKRIDWNVGYSNKTLLDTFEVSPMEHYQVTTDNGAYVRSYTPVSFLARMFLQWRGGIKYRMKFVKTQFHSGRLLICYSPWNNYEATSAPTSSVDLSAYTHREIVDIRDITEYEFTIPYTAITPWLKTRGRPTKMGTVFIYVLDSLVFPATVPSVVPIILEIAGADDLSFAVPVMEDTYQVYRPATLQSGIPSLGGSSLQSDGLKEASTCVGEVVLSLRSLIKRPCYMTSQLDQRGIFYIYPYIFETARGAASTFYPTAIGGTNMVTMISSCYALTRGSMSYRILYPNVGSTNPIPDKPIFGITLEDTWWWYNGSSYVEVDNTDRQIDSDSNANTYDNSAISGSRFRPFLTVVDKLSGGLQFTVPQYFTAHSRPMASAFVTPSTQPVFKSIGTTPSWRVKITCTSTFDWMTVLQYGADDYSCHRFVSVPPMIETTAVPA
jgi:hypothetical protein